LPVVAPVGTVTAMLVALQLVTLALLLAPLNITVLVPCVAPKLVPAIVTAVPTGPELGDRLVIPGVTAKLEPVLDTLATVTTTDTLPKLKPLGTVTTMVVEFQLVTLAPVLPKFTVLVPCADPKLLPEIVTGVPTGPEVGDRLVILGVGSTVKLEPLLATPPTVTTTLPVVAPVGTVTTMPVALQPVTLALLLAPLNITVLLPWAAPKLVPVIVTGAPTAPEVGERLVIPGVTAKLEPVLATLATVTTTDALPKLKPLGTVTAMLVALQLVTVAPVLPKVTVLVPCAEPKPVPAIVIGVPTGPEAGERLEMVGVTVKLDPLLATPPTVTTTLPVVAPLGTVTAMLVAPQLVTVAVAPAKVTVLPPCVAPKLVPVIVTGVPTVPEVGDRLVMPGVTAKLEPVLAWPPTVTTTDALPKLKPLGTVTTMLVALQVLTAALVLPNFTVLLPCVAPKLLPVIVTAVPTGPEVGDRLPMLGPTVTVTATLWPAAEKFALVVLAVMFAEPALFPAVILKPPGTLL
jgi:hypothetical protein